MLAELSALAGRWTVSGRLVDIQGNNTYRQLRPGKHSLQAFILPFRSAHPVKSIFSIPTILKKKNLPSSRQSQHDSSLIDL